MVAVVGGCVGAAPVVAVEQMDWEKEVEGQSREMADSLDGPAVAAEGAPEVVVEGSCAEAMEVAEWQAVVVGSTGS